MENDYTGTGDIHLAPGYTSSEGKTIYNKCPFVVRNGFFQVTGPTGREIFPAAALLRIDAGPAPKPTFRVG